MDGTGTPKMGVVVFTLLLVTAALCSCAPPPSAAPDTNAPTSRPATSLETPTELLPTSAPVTTDYQHSLSFQARADLASRLQIDASGVQIISDAELEMPTGSLGCGNTDGVTNPGIIVGHELVLAADGKEYTYRSDGQRLVPCSPAAFPGGRDPLFAAGSAAAMYRAQSIALATLADKLAVAKDTIVLIQEEPVLWPDASLGCPAPGMVYAEMITPGYRIVMEADGETFEAHTDAGNAVVICQP